MPHPRPTGEAEALSTMLRSATAQIHKDAEQRPFMKAFFGGSLPRDAYIGWLRRQWHLYRALEHGLGRLPDHDPAAHVVPPELHRTERIEADLDHLTAGSWRRGDDCTPATAAYVERIESTYEFPAGLVAHAWLRYMGNVGGRDVLRRLVAGAVGAADGDEGGLAFTDYSAVGEIRPFFAGFHARLDSLPLSDEDKRRAVAEADAGFRLNIALTDELADDFVVGAASGS